MASLRGGTTLFDAATVDPGDDTTITSALAAVGSDPYVTIYIDSDQDADFDLEVGYNPTGVTAGRNAFDDTDVPDGGLVWFKYAGASGDTNKLSVKSGVSQAFDVSPFGPQLVRLVRTDSGTSATVTAYVSNFGPN